MTISEQIREAALYADIPAWQLIGYALHALRDFEDDFDSFLWRDDQSRTWLLLVAEALE